MNAYDGDGNRVSETAGGVTTRYVVDTLNLTGYSQVLDEVAGGVVTKTYAYGLQRVSENQLAGSTWTPSFYGYDGHGNVRFLANTAGSATNTYQFDAFGMSVASTGTTANNYLYSAERFDPNISLYHLRARYYNQGTGRFETTDPDPGKIFDPGTLHKYVYTGNNPVNRIDPLGRADIAEYLSILTDIKGVRDNASFASKLAFCSAVAFIDTAGALAGVSSGGQSISQSTPNCVANVLRDPFELPGGWNPIPEVQ